MPRNYGGFAPNSSNRSRRWGWANDQHTRVRIPIARAMTILVQKGAEAYAPLLPPTCAERARGGGAKRDHAVCAGNLRQSGLRSQSNEGLRRQLRSRWSR